MGTFLRLAAVAAALVAFFAPAAAARPGGEPEPGKEVCFAGGWELIGYRDQGECVRSFVAVFH